MNENVTQLLDKAVHAQRAAEILFRENELDSSAGRCYYAMFYAAQALLALEGHGPFRKHAAVHAAFGEHLAKTGKVDPKLHRWLLDSFDKRIVGDYGLGVILTKEDLVDLIEHANEFLQTVRGLISSPR